MRFASLLPLLALPWLPAEADIVILSSGKEITGKILSYQASEGLVVQTEYGRITVSSGNLVSFQIRDDSVAHSAGAAPVRYAESSLYQAGLRIDTTRFRGFQLGFDTQLNGSGTVYPFLARDEKRGIYFTILGEPLGIENNEYFEIAMTTTRGNFEYFIDGERKDFTANGIDFITKEFGGRAQGLEFRYLVAFFAHEGVNYRFLGWMHKAVYRNESARARELVKAISAR